MSQVPGTQPLTNKLRDIYEAPDRVWPERPDLVRLRAALLAGYLPDPGLPLRILDLGCGGGNNTVGLRETFRLAELLGVDWSVRAATLARDSGLGMVVGSLDGSNLPFAPATLDAVILACGCRKSIAAGRSVVLIDRLYSPDNCAGSWAASPPGRFGWIAQFRRSIAR